ncbi:disease resistance protein RPP2B-like [Camellia sinensis]|uniref:disease resistance protein RPP2B-like n=1 Tax=Camellia sinensis TaxID=4442 RepID=UPI001035FBCA|nr:disease resistance protein RPP2B-like [Camellia sinensis]
MKYLTVLHADGTAINRIATTTSEDKSWSSLFWSWVLKPRKSTESIYFPLASLPGSLVSLSLSNCNLSNDDLMKSLGSLSVLQDLNLSENPISSLPESIKGLNVLQSLRLSRCTRLQSLPELPMSLEMLNIDGCSSLGMVTNLPNLLRSLILDSSDCEKLVEVQGMFKLEPIGNAGAEVINKLGLVDLESMGSLEVELLNNMTSTRKKGPLQGLYECGIYSIFVPGNEVPGWCSNKGKGSSISFNVPLVLNLKIVALNIYIVYAFANDISLASHQFDYIKINNKTKGLKWTYSPMFRGIPDDNSMIWFSHWEIGHLLMEGGDKMNLSASFDELYQVKEVGVQIVYDECEEKGIQHHNAHPSLHNVMNVGDLSEYHVRTGSYFLCHHGYDSHQDYHQDGSSSKTDKILFGDSEETTGFTDEE